jgi:ribosomal protein S18
MSVTIAPTAVGTFRDKKGRFWVNVEVLCDFLGVNFQIERRKIKTLGFLHPHTFQRSRRVRGGLYRRYYILSLPAHELGPWVATIAEAPSYKDPRSGRRLVADRSRIDHVRRTNRQQKALARVSAGEQQSAISA